MSARAIYLDNHASTRLDPRVLDAMLPFFDPWYANSGSVTHEAGREVKQRLEQAQAELAGCLGADPSELVITSGATESNNLATFGVCLHPRQKRRRIVSVCTEHRALLDPLLRLESSGFEVVRLTVQQSPSPHAGLIDLDLLETLITDDTCLVSVMFANNEIGALQPLTEIARRCHAREVLLHTDATQAVGRVDVDVDRLGVDLMSFSAHKFYGPKGVGGLYVRNRDRRVRLHPTIVGGGQQQNRRSGTINSAGLAGMSAALKLCEELAGVERDRLRGLRDRLWERLLEKVPGIHMNGPSLIEPELRLGTNLNCEFPGVEGQSLMGEVPSIAMSSGSACTSAEPRPSHVLTAIGLTEEQARCSLRMGIGRFNTADEIDEAADRIAEAYRGLTLRF